MGKKKEKSIVCPHKRHPDKDGQTDLNRKNWWKHGETLKQNLESQKMNETLLALLCCREKYRIRQIAMVFDESDWKNELF